MRFSEALHGFWLDKELQLSVNTVQTYKFYFASFVECLGDKEVEKITSNDIKHYLSWLVNDKGLSRRSAHDRYAVLSSFWSWAETELGIEHIIKGKVRKPKYTKTIVEPFTNDELKKLLSANTDDRMSVIIRVLLDSGIRISELCDLRIHDYDKDNGKLFIERGKGDKNRIVFLGTKTRKALWKMLLNREINKNDYLFVTKNNTRLNRNNIRRDISKIGKELGIKAHPHKFRHTFAVSFLRNGGNIKQLQDILGHESIKTVTIYLKLAEVDLQQAKAFSPVDNL